MKEEARRKGREGGKGDSCYRHNVAAAADIKQHPPHHHHHHLKGGSGGDSLQSATRAIGKSALQPGSLLSFPFHHVVTAAARWTAFRRTPPSPLAPPPPELETTYRCTSSAGALN